jgi:hypothetical protein
MIKKGGKKVRNKYLSSVLLSILFTTSLMVPLLSFSIMSQTVSATPGVWETKAQWPGNVATWAVLGCYAENQGVAYIYGLEQDTTSPYVIGSMYRYRIASDSWENMGTSPIQIVSGGMVWTGADNIYIMAGGSSAQNLFYSYSISDNTWTPLTSTGTSALSGSGLAWDGGDNIYASIRSSTPANADLWVYSISGGGWTDKIALPASAASGSNLCKVGDYVYYGVGNSTAYWRYSVASNTWDSLAAVGAGAGGNWGAGSGQEKVNENIIYADLGRTTTNFYRFIIRDNRWDTMESLPDTVTAAGDRLAFDGTYLYQIRGSTDNQFWRYEVAKYFEKYCMPDLGQHSKNWCWVAAAANSIYWYSQHGYLKLIDAPENAVENDNNYITQMIPTPPPDLGDSAYRLFFEIASDCGHGWGEGILDNEYFYGLQKFMNDQGVPLLVHEIVNPALVSSPPPENGNIVIYRSPTLMDYETQLENYQDVLLWLNYHHENLENYDRNETTDHVVTGVAFNDNNWILVSDPWTTGSPDHNDNFDNKLYDNLRVLSAPNDPLKVQYAGVPGGVLVSKIVFISPGAAPAVTYGVDVSIQPPTTQSGLPGTTLSYSVQVTNTGNALDTYTLTASDNASPTWSPTVAPPSLTLAGGGIGFATLSVTIPNNENSGAIDNLTVTATGTGVSDTDSCIAQVTDHFKKWCMPDLGQHSKNWCWIAAAANSIYWYSQHGYPQLIDDPENAVENDNNYITQMIGPLPCGDFAYRLFLEIASDCGSPVWDWGILDNYYFLGLQKFMNDQGVPLFVHEIVNPALVSSPPPSSENVIYRSPTLMDYETQLENCQDVLLWLHYSHENIENYDRNETTDHVVTGVGFSYDNQWLIVSDPWTPGAPDHSNDLTHTLTPYDDLPVMSAENENLWVQYNGIPVQVSKIVYISPTAVTENVPENVPENLVAGWNLVHFPVTSANNTPNNIFDNQTYYIWRWSAENKKYVSPLTDNPVELGVGYWVWVGYGQTVTTSGVPVDTYSENLKTSWNLVGFPVTSNNTTPANLFDNQTYYIWRWDAVHAKYVSPPTDNRVQIDVGYWIWVGYDQTITVPVV